MIKVAIVGGTGYTGVELLRLLTVHPEVELTAITSRALAGTPVAELFPNLRGHCDLHFCEPDVEQLAAGDLVFFATPHGVAQAQVPELVRRGVRVIDLSADFRLKNIPLWEQWYGQRHAAPELAEKAVYGLPEVNRASIANAQLVACPGCYPTSIQLGWIPLLEAGLVKPETLIASAASGASGAGRQGKTELLLAENSDNFRAYAAAGHRHLPEIEQGLRRVQPAGADAPKVTFVPHLLPMVRGIHATLFAKLQSDCPAEELQLLFEARYKEEPFVDVMPAGSHPQTRSVRGTNMCRVSVMRPQDRDTVVVMSVIDNLAKGASAQAVQNMNIMFGLNETQGLESPALLP
ncbi:N-acetyl-gamma-glutamyl-phosphate reductase [Microbulbifer thermotolerans]|uniref:N-acetyl-gamma-glutamyl-phosphate reductase n=1 Tax=Microbulbifer thermotolerans TaxID=252514 RepID=A0A143HIK9_MICTH|nr:N-acetyl-gamma-glutamyl-phosphate reductase [Microbulbifer thermotolerans]AMX01558.1 N-acetyl-gamma-glutamyl-phosphate reductase [Microbulbifer thermotolerans]MCX2778413.1 N-acetyl-gamma-glutamyl-phosphate reductase [Microbulbifer thermotolerans]MCX2784169.1 N-acetyl-gamma-glutamyl-phosphate reductase [Microbulbifer thermotolerans]MCX2796182.1 N-acetyl-gamma-glutamyl-phosphate reductase [Microbulbifer thermotolerans]MCX2803284.1 N-acetyl-gamma-glutamyl-phosphate reductase [Microbulbifer the